MWTYFWNSDGLFGGQGSRESKVRMTAKQK